MGIKLKDLFEFSTLTTHELSGKRVAIDGPNMLFQILFNPVQHQKGDSPGQFYTDRSQRIINHLYGWLHKITNCYKFRITPIVVFDGRPDALKRAISKDTGHDFLAIKQKYEDALQRGDLNNAKIFAQSKSFMWMNCVRESKELLEALGVPVIMAPSEAEAQCAALQQAGVVDYVVSADFDVALFGASNVIRYLTFKPKELKEGFKCYNVQENLSRLAINWFQLIDLSLLLGNDYYPGITKIGPKTALKTIQLYKTIEIIRLKHPELINELSQGLVENIRQLYIAPEVRKIASTVPAWIQKDRVLFLLCQDHSLNPEKVHRQLANLMYYAKRNGQSIDTIQKTFPELNDFKSSSGNDFVCATKVVNNPRPENLPKPKLHPKKPLVIDSDAQINGFRRIEVWAAKDDLKVFYLDKDTPIEDWPELVQVQFYTIIEILVALGLIPKKVYDAKYAERMNGIGNRCQQIISLLEDMVNTTF